MEENIDDVDVPGHITKLCDSLYQLQKRGYLCDVVIETKSGNISAHKIILIASGSSFLQEQIYRATSMGQILCNISFKDELYEDVLAAVRFIYTGKLNSTYDRSWSFGKLLRLLEINIENVKSMHEKKVKNSETSEKATGIVPVTISKESTSVDDNVHRSLNEDLSITIKGEPSSELDGSEPPSELDRVDPTLELDRAEFPSELDNDEPPSDINNTDLNATEFICKVRIPGSQNLTKNVIVVSKSETGEYVDKFVEDEAHSETDADVSDLENYAVEHAENSNLLKDGDEDMEGEMHDADQVCNNKQSQNTSAGEKFTLKRKRPTICDRCKLEYTECKCKTKTKLYTCEKTGKTYRITAETLQKRLETICSLCSLNLMECSCKAVDKGRQPEKTICKLCKIKFPSVKDYTEHKNEKHSIKCNVCDYEATHGSSLSSHMMTEHSLSNIQVEKKEKSDKVVSSKKINPQPLRKKYGLYSPSSLSEAYIAVKDQNMSVKGAARQYNVPVSTLRDRVLGKIDPETMTRGRTPIFTQLEESDFVEYLKVVANYGHGCSRQETVDMASDYAHQLNKFNKDRQLTLKWFRGFVRRWPDVHQIIKPRNLEEARVIDVLLLGLDDHKKKVKFEEGANILQTIKSTFGLFGQEDYFLQIYNKEFDEFIDLEDNEQIADKSKIKIIRKKKNCFDPATPDEVSREDMSASIQEDTFISRPNTPLSSMSETSLSSKQNTPISSQTDLFLSSRLQTPCSPRPVCQAETSASSSNDNGGSSRTLDTSKHFPSVVRIQTERFSSLLTGALNKKSALSWRAKQEILDILVNYIYNYTAFPTLQQRETVAKALVEQYPHLKESIGSGYDGWTEKITNKMKKLRLDLKVVKEKVRKNKKKPDKKLGLEKKGKKLERGELNYVSNDLEGEDEANHTKHKEIIKKEMRKRTPVAEILENSMDATFSFRRKFLKSSPKFSVIKEMYPVLFTIDGQMNEFRRLTNIDIKSTLSKEFLKLGKVMVAGAEEKKIRFKKCKATAVDRVISQMKQQNQDVKPDKEIYNMAIAGVLLMPLLLNEPLDELVTFGEDKLILKKKTMESTCPMLICEGSPFAPGVINIVGESTELIEGEEFLSAVAALFSLYYTCDVEYPKSLEGSFRFIQNTILNLQGGKVPTKIITLTDLIKKT